MNIAQPNCVLADPGVMGLIEEDGFTKFTLNGDHFNQQCYTFNNFIRCVYF